MNILLKKLLAWLTLSISLLPYGALGSQDLYTCTIYEMSELTKAGILKAGSLKDLVKGQKFTIDRNTGNIGGNSILGSREGFRKTSLLVVDRGGDEQAFQMAIVDPTPEAGTRISIIYVEEYTEGAQKPFYATQSGAVVTGICE